MHYYEEDLSEQHLLLLANCSEQSVTDTAREGDMPVTEAERKLLRSEFMRIMQLRFLSGDDPEFNYW